MRENWRQTAEDAYRSHYTEWWKSAFDCAPDRPSFVLLGPSTYLLNIYGTSVLIDPVFRFPWIRELVRDRWQADLASADVILYTHTHTDHYSPDTVVALKDTEANVVIPDFFDCTPLEKGGFPMHRLRMSTPGKSIQVDDIRITTFASVHTRPSGQAFYPEYGYLLETPAGRLLFPCDVRNYDVRLFPILPQPDWLFLHVWLKGGNAGNLPCEPYLSEFARFAAHWKPHHVSLAHLYEIGRAPEELWTFTHAGLCADAILAEAPDTDIQVPRIGKHILL